MPLKLSPQQVFFVLGTALGIVAVMVFALFFLVRALRKERKEMNMSLNVPRTQDDSVFMIASLQGVVAGLKAREKELETQLRDAEARADVNQRALETVVRVSAQGIVTFDATGTLGMANPAARNMLSLDTHSRRRYLDLFPPDSPLSVVIQDCLEISGGCRSGRARYTSAGGTARSFDVAVYPFTGRGGQIAGVVCVFSLVSP
jgi:PAS domain-containing protein